MFKKIRKIHLLKTIKNSPEYSTKRMEAMRNYYNYHCKLPFKVAIQGKYFQLNWNNGITYLIDDQNLWDAAVTVVAYLQKYNIKEGDVIIDCGSFIGNFALYASRAVGKTGRVYCFEPNEKNYERLTANLALNQMDNVYPLKLAVWSETTLLMLKSRNELSNIAKDGDVLVQTTTLDNFGINANFIKIDVEGAELEIIKGAEKTLSAFKTPLAIATHNIIDGKFSDFAITPFLQNLGYKVEVGFPDYRMLYGVKA